MKRIGLLLLLSGVVAIMARPSAMIPDQVRIDTGMLSGVVGATQPGVRVFKGIPFAAPPLGDNRWRAPQPAAKWDGVRPASAFGAPCTAGGGAGRGGGRRGGGAPGAAPGAAPVAAPAPVSAAPAIPAAPEGHVVKAPMVGTAYAAASPDAPPFVKVGDKVKVGDPLCIIEAMKMMNRIESDHAGTVVAVMVENGKPVEFDQPLFIIQ